MRSFYVILLFLHLEEVLKHDVNPSIQKKLHPLKWPSDVQIVATTSLVCKTISKGTENIDLQPMSVECTFDG